MDFVSKYDNNLSQNPKNLEALIVSIFYKHFQLEANSSITGIDTQLIIERSTGKILELKAGTSYAGAFEKPIQIKKCSLMIGIVHIMDKPFLVLADEVLPVCTLQNNQIFHLNTISLLPFDLDYDYNTSKGKEIQNNVNTINQLLSTGFYFSYQMDMTLCKQRQAESESTDINFAWNYYMLKDFESKQISKFWLVPIIQGFVGTFWEHLDQRIELYLISRRSSRNAGTRYNTRGLDDQGSAANFVQTEQIIYYNKFCCSHVQIRGSTPLFWQQGGLTSQTRLTRSPQLTKPVFMRHFDSLNKKYGKIFCINLMSKTKENEQMLTESFESLVQSSTLETVRYEFFDFNLMCKGGNYDQINSLINQVTPVLSDLQYYAEDLKQWKALFRQNGALRISCLDSLDRTNVVMTKFAMKMIDIQLKIMGVDLKALYGLDGLSQLDNLKSSSSNLSNLAKFTISFQNIWADNGDLLSYHYCGTGSTTSEVTRYGKSGFLGFIDSQMKSLGRLYNSNFEDQEKQRGIDIILGEHREIVNQFDSFLAKVLQIREREYCTYEPVSIFVTSWNMNGNQLSYETDLKNRLFDFEGQNPPDIIVVGLQEMVQLNVKNVVVTNNEKIVDHWQHLLSTQLIQIDNYHFLMHKDLVGVYMAIFIKENLKGKVNRVEAEVVQTGMMGGKFGNKGAVLIRLFIDDSSFCFISCHLESGGKAINERFSNIVDIHTKAFVGESKKNFQIDLCDYQILLGDMNFRLDMPYIEAQMILEQYNQLLQAGQQRDALDIIEKLLEQDQLIKLQLKNDYIKYYEEATITFPPTYQYDIGTQIYDTSQKQRTPSYCDRILLWKEDNVVSQQLFYTRREFLESDHRPVCTYYILQVKQINREKLEDLKRKIGGEENLPKQQDQQDFKQVIDFFRPKRTLQAFNSEEPTTLQQANNQIQFHKTESINSEDPSQPNTSDHIIQKKQAQPEPDII